MTIPAGGQSLYGITAAELMDDDVQMLSTGAVVGTFPYVKEFKGFSDVPDEQEGNYCWIKLGDQYTGKQITVQRTSGGGGDPKVSEDMDWILRLTDGAETAFTVKADSVPDLNVTFRGATLKPKE